LYRFFEVDGLLERAKVFENRFAQFLELESIDHDSELMPGSIAISDIVRSLCLTSFTVSALNSSVVCPAPDLSLRTETIFQSTSTLSSNYFVPQPNYRAQII